MAPWEDISIIMIGPWTVEVSNRKVEFNTLTLIENASNLVWGHENGQQNLMPYTGHICQMFFLITPTQFIVYTTKTVSSCFDIKDVHSTSKNLQFNLIYMHMYQTVGTVLRILLHSNPLQNLRQASNIVIRP